MIKLVQVQRCDCIRYDHEIEGFVDWTCNGGDMFSWMCQHTPASYNTSTSGSKSF